MNCMLHITLMWGVIFLRYIVIGVLSPSVIIVRFSRRSLFYDPSLSSLIVNSVGDAALILCTSVTAWYASDPVYYL